MGYRQRQHRPQPLLGTRKGGSNHYFYMHLCPGKKIPSHHHGAIATAQSLKNDFLVRLGTILSALERMPVSILSFDGAGRQNDRATPRRGPHQRNYSPLKERPRRCSCAALSLSKSPLSFSLPLRRSLTLTISSYQRNTYKK